jgi:hypothetical protein
MPLYEFRLEAQDGSGHFRQGTIEADTKDVAQATLEMRELEYTLYRLGDDPNWDQAAAEALHGADTLDAALALPKGEKMPAHLPPKVRAKLALHRQAKPYKIVKLTERMD